MWDAGLKPGSTSEATARTTVKTRATAITKAKAKAKYSSLCPSGFAPAFGRVVAPAAGVAFGTAEAGPLSKAGGVGVGGFACRMCESDE